MYRPHVLPLQPGLGTSVVHYRSIVELNPERSHVGSEHETLVGDEETSYLRTKQVPTDGKELL